MTIEELAKLKQERFEADCLEEIESICKDIDEGVLDFGTDENKK